MTESDWKHRARDEAGDDRHVEVGLALFLVSFLCIGVPLTMPFSPVNAAADGNYGTYELHPRDTTESGTPITIFAYRDLPEDAQQIVRDAIESESRENVTYNASEIRVFPTENRDQPTVFGVQYEGEYYEFEVRVTEGGTDEDVRDVYEHLITLFAHFGLLVALVGFVYYTDFGGPHSLLPAAILGGLALGSWVLAYAVPFRSVTQTGLSGAFWLELIGVSLFLGLSAWRYVRATADPST